MRLLKSLLLVLSLLLLGACGVKQQSPRAATAAASAPVIATPYSGRSPHPRILVSYDMEGLGGISDWRLWESRYPDSFVKGQQLLAGELNAVVDGLFAGGASAVEVFDQHGSGRPDTQPDMPAELLDARAHEVLMSEIVTAQSQEEHRYDAVVTIGGHSRAGNGGFASHTVSSGAAVVANGIALTEVSLIAYQWGENGVPLIMAAGTDTLGDDLKDFPWIEYVTVKRTRTAAEAELLPLDEVHAQLRAAAQRAVRNIAHARIVVLAAPITITVSSVPPGDLSELQGIPGVHYADGHVTFEAPRLNPEGASGLVALSGFAQRSGQQQLLRDVVIERPDGAAMLMKGADLYITRWLDHESSLRKRD